VVAFLWIVWKLCGLCFFSVVYCVLILLRVMCNVTMVWICVFVLLRVTYNVTMVWICAYNVTMVWICTYNVTMVWICEGLGDEEDRTVPTVVDSLKYQQCQEISCGGGHSVVLTASGDVYTFGWGLFGALGHGNLYSQGRPRLVERMTEVASSISGGGSITAVVTGERTLCNTHATCYVPMFFCICEYQWGNSEGRWACFVFLGLGRHGLWAVSGHMWTWGSGICGMLGTGSEDNALFPVRIDVDGRRCVSVSSGSSHAAAVVE